MIQENYTLFTLLASGGLFIGMLLSIDLGARRRKARRDRKEDAGTGTIEGGVFALLGLLIALTFTGAADRINERSKVTIDESDALGTAFLRLDTLAKTDRENARVLLRDYTAARIEEYAHIRVIADHLLSQQKTAVLRDRLWDFAVTAAARSPYPHSSQLVLPLLNDCFDIAGRREALRRIHPPGIIYTMLIVISLLASLLAGYGLADADDRRWLHRIGFTAATSFAFFVTLNMEHPRMGIINLGERDLVLTETLKEMDRLLSR